jgi:sigma-B regulation protein RsbU (phosphoserine phosphatase)
VTVSTPKTGNRSSGPAHALVVEDDQGSRDLVEHLLVDEGYVVESTSDAEAALHLLATGAQRFHVALLDWMLPGMSGLDLLRQMKAAPALEPIPVIFLTARTDREALMAAVAAGAAYFVPKPLDRELLKTMVATAAADYSRLQVLRETEQRGKTAAGTLVEGHFRLRTLAEATALAALLSKACPVPERTVSGLGELLINAVEHGNLGITYEEKSELLATRTWTEEVARRLGAPEHRDKWAEVHFVRTPGQIVVTISDRGAGFDWQRFLTISPDRIFHAHGRGIAMANLMSFDRLEYVAPGNRVIATVELAAAGE